jgi:TolB protein
MGTVARQCRQIRKDITVMSLIVVAIATILAETGADEKPKARDTQDAAVVDHDGERSLTGLIAIQANRDGDSEIYTVRPDGSGLTQVTNNEAKDGAPRLSPDGERIAFVSDREDGWEVYVMDVDGSGVERITDLSEGARLVDDLAWSPDGTRLAFTDIGPAKSGRAPTVYVVDACGGQATPVLESACSPSWSPDGLRIAFSRISGSSMRIYTADADGQNQRSLLETPPGRNRVIELAPHWSPDGSLIAFMDDCDRLPSGNVNQPRNSDIYVANADGSNLRRLAGGPSHQGMDAWSPDGKHILAWVNEQVAPHGRLVIYDLKGVQMQLVADAPLNANSGSWSVAPSESENEKKR